MTNAESIMRAITERVTFSFIDTQVEHSLTPSLASSVGKDAIIETPAEFAMSSEVANNAATMGATSHFATGFLDLEEDGKNIFWDALFGGWFSALPILLSLLLIFDSAEGEEGED